MNRKLLKKHDFLTWKSDSSPREVQVMRRYHLQSREDYMKYNQLTKPSISIVEQLYDMGLLDMGTKFSDIVKKVNVSCFCRRRLPVVMVRMKMSETVGQAVKYVEQGHVRVGPDTITDPAYLVTRNMEDFVSWLDTSSIKRTIAKYNDELDDFDLM